MTPAKILNFMGKSNAAVAVLEDKVAETVAKKSVSVSSEGITGRQARVNLLLAVKDHAQNQIDGISDEIAAMEAKLRDLYREREYIQRMREVAMDYYSPSV